MKFIFLISILFFVSCKKSQLMITNPVNVKSDSKSDSEVDLGAEAGGNASGLISLYGNNSDPTIHEIDVVVSEKILIPGRVKSSMTNGDKVFAGWCSELPCDVISDRNHLVGEEFTVSGAYSLYALWVDSTANWSSATIGELVVPNGVTTIETYAFLYKDLTKLIISDSVTTIGASAFYWNYLTSVTFSNSLTTIGSNSFYQNLITNVTFPDSITTIGDNAFRFNKITSLTIPNSIITIGEYAFASNELTSVDIPDSMTNIKASSFSYNLIESVTISSNVTTIGINAFAGNPLKNVTIGAGVTMDSTSIPNNFSTAYTAFGKVAGRYTWDGANWISP